MTHNHWSDCFYIRIKLILYKIDKTKDKAEAEKLISKLRVYTISDQDDSGIWIRNNFPGLFYIVTPGDHYGSATWTGINEIESG